MTPADLVECTGLISGYWPSWEATEAALFAAERQLLDLPKEFVVAALDDLAGQGDRFAPPVGLIGKRARELMSIVGGSSVPELDQAWSEVMDVANRLGFERGKDWVWSHRAIANAVRVVSWRRLCYDEKQGFLFAQFRDVYEPIAERIGKSQVAPPVVGQMLDVASRQQLDAGGSRELNA